MNFELIDNLFQVILMSGAAILSAGLAFRKKSRQLLILAFAYGTFAMGTIYWLLHLAITGMVPQIFFVAEISWGASYLFLLSLQIARTEKIKIRCSIPGLLAAFIASNRILWYRILGPSYFFSTIFSLTVSVIVYLAVFRLQTKVSGRRVDLQLLILIILQMALYIVSRSMEDFQHFNLYFAIDISLTLCWVGMLPLILREVEV